MTELRYLPDADDVTTFEATVAEVTDDYVVLDGTYFYPEGGGQPPDHGVLEWGEGRNGGGSGDSGGSENGSDSGGSADVVNVRKNHGDVRHYIDNVDGELPEPGGAVTGRIDEERRWNHRRMHTAQHVVSRVVLDEYGAKTAGNQIHEDRSRIDFSPADFGDEDVRRIERLTNDAIARDLAVTKAERPREEVEERVDEGRSLLHLIPDHVDPLRVVAVEDFDYCPCGGTHVDSLDEIGRVRITNRESKGEDTMRVEFALDEARA